mmetsp:Transcript_1712/g.5962  ORF Transcript_1712/g.5962 Transcript_1712/m.5962 type:complete len:470 (-) Transcript_1712:1513-2922(-)
MLCRNLVWAPRVQELLSLIFMHLRSRLQGQHLLLVCIVVFQQAGRGHVLQEPEVRRARKFHNSRPWRALLKVTSLQLPKGRQLKRRSLVLALKRMLRSSVLMLVLAHPTFSQQLGMQQQRSLFQEWAQALLQPLLLVCLASSYQHAHPKLRCLRSARMVVLLRCVQQRRRCPTSSVLHNKQQQRSLNLESAEPRRMGRLLVCLRSSGRTAGLDRASVNSWRRKAASEATSSQLRSMLLQMLLFQVWALLQGAALKATSSLLRNRPQPKLLARASALGPSRVPLHLLVGLLVFSRQLNEYKEVLEVLRRVPVQLGTTIYMHMLIPMSSPLSALAVGWICLLLHSVQQMMCSLTLARLRMPVQRDQAVVNLRRSLILISSHLHEVLLKMYLDREYLQVSPMPVVRSLVWMTSSQTSKDHLQVQMMPPEWAASLTYWGRRVEQPMMLQVFSPALNLTFSRSQGKPPLMPSLV